jgi:hypothetical protein
MVRCALAGASRPAHPDLVDDDGPATAAWIDELERLPVGDRPAAPEVRLLDYPVQLGVRQQTRTADLMRELQLIELDTERQPSATSTPERLLAFATDLYDAFGPALEQPREELESAFAGGVAAIEQRYPLVPASRATMLIYARLMERADEFSRSGLVMSLAPDPEIYALRRWTVEEFVRQYAGLAPRSWPAVHGRLDVTSSQTAAPLETA